MSAVEGAVEQVARPRPATGPERAVWDVAATVTDPEVPVLTIEDLGVLRGVRFVDGSPVVDITPTYSGCPAVDAIRDDIVAVLREHGHPRARVAVVLSPAWTTDWMSDAGRRKLVEHGIAPPGRRAGGVVALGLGVRCPRCGSLHTRELARFGSTSCKALYVCQRCREPFDHFKEH
ncbi:1,2-phenylacetyl-CoA epoxidase subunit PaaD [Promicromonospora sp. NPDC019610]|uniref:1,2-phenylacetyl-CoA epoxidase subunit PaaD n=1 Tax=Promicromonospora sp. NPDC019610 TaxID=3364405 RepID=UPI00378F8F69